MIKMMMSDCFVTLVWFEVVLMWCCNLCCDLCITCFCFCTMLTTTVPIWTLLRRKQKNCQKVFVLRLCCLCLFLFPPKLFPAEQHLFAPRLPASSKNPAARQRQAVLKAVNHTSSSTPPKTSCVVFVACECTQWCFLGLIPRASPFFWPFLQPSDRAF